MRMDRGAILRLSTIVAFSILTLSGFGFSAYMVYIAHGLYDDMLAITFIVLAVVAGAFNITASIWFYKSYFYDGYLKSITRGLKPLERMPTVAIAVPVFNENPKLVERNMLRLMTLKYPKGKARYYMLDDSTESDVAEELRAFSRRNGIRYMHRTERTGFKAGALNNLLKNSDEEFIAIFDYDERLVNRNFLTDLLPYFENEEVSYVQTTKRYAKGTFFSDSVELFNGFFFKFIQPARALNNTAIFAGSCGIIRRSALDKIGGFPEYVIEDTFFSLESDIQKFKSLYVPKVYALGRPIKTFTELVKQQWRYNYGDTQFINYFLEKRKKGRGGMSPMASVDYITHGLGLNYLSVVLILFTLVSVLVVLSSVPFVSMTIQQFFEAKYLPIDFEIFGLLAFALAFFVPILLTRIYFKSMSKGIMVFLLNYALAVVRAKAAIAALLKRSASSAHWSREGKRTTGNRLLFSIYNTRVELLFTGALTTLGFYAITIHHISGGLWLLWYGVLYCAATVLFYKYG